jgi:hypothetical protein
MWRTQAARSLQRAAGKFHAIEALPTGPFRPRAAQEDASVRV